MSRIHIFTVSAAIAGAGALAAMALNLSFMTVFLCMCAATSMAFAAVASEYAMRRRLEQLNHVLGQFMRGQWQARHAPAAGDDEFVRLQHRLNNLLDMLDVHLRGADAAIDAATHAEYIEKLKQTPLALALAKQEAAEEEPAIAPAGSVGALLQQLGHDVAGLFNDDGEPAHDAPEPLPEPEEEAPGIREEDLRAMAARMNAAALQLQAACTELSQRALPPGFMGPGPSPVTLEATLARMAEQVTVVALNVAIEAARAQPDSSLYPMAEELQDMAALLHKARGEVKAALAPHHRQSGPVSVPLAAAIEALAVAEQTLRSEALAVDALLELPEAQHPEFEEAA